MSCCGFPPASQEAHYPIHPALWAHVVEWEFMSPGVGKMVQQTIGNGDYERMEGLDVPPFTLDQSFDEAYACLEKSLHEQARLQLLKKGPWWVRWGLKTPSVVLPIDQQHFLSSAKKALEATRAGLSVQWTCGALANKA